jgi:hypothetical protein
VPEGRGQKKAAAPEARGRPSPPVRKEKGPQPEGQGAFRRAQDGRGSPDNHNEIGHALVLVVDKLDVLPAGDPKNWLAFTVDPQELTFHALR